jgi:hypothetical protein
MAMYFSDGFTWCDTAPSEVMDTPSDWTTVGWKQLVRLTWKERLSALWHGTVWVNVQFGLKKGK